MISCKLLRECIMTIAWLSPLSYFQWLWTSCSFSSIMLVRLSYVSCTYWLCATELCFMHVLSYVSCTYWLRPSLLSYPWIAILNLNLSSAYFATEINIVKWRKYFLCKEHQCFNNEWNVSYSQWNAPYVWDV